MSASLVGPIVNGKTEVKAGVNVRKMDGLPTTPRYLDQRLVPLCVGDLIISANHSKTESPRDSSATSEREFRILFGPEAILAYKSYRGNLTKTLLSRRTSD